MTVGVQRLSSREIMPQMQNYNLCPCSSLSEAVRESMLLDVCQANDDSDSVMQKSTGQDDWGFIHYPAAFFLH